MHHSPESFDLPPELSWLIDESPEHKPERLHISTEFLKKLYGSRSFLRKLNSTMDLVDEFSGREFGFVMWKDSASERIWLSRPAGGDLDDEVNVRTQHDEIDRLLKERYPEKTAVRVSKLHFHGVQGREANVIVPSGSGFDLGAADADRRWNESRGFDVPSTEIIGLVDGSEASLLFLQEPLQYRPIEQHAIRDEIDLTFDELSASWTTTQAEVIAALKHYNYKAMLVETSDRKLKDEDLVRVAQEFSFS